MAPKFAIASLSLGTCAHHDLPTKIRTAARLGYDGIEIFIPDFEAFVDEVNDGLHLDLFPGGKQPTQDSFELECAKAISSLCDSLYIAIPVLQPLRGFENFASPNSLGGGGLPAALKEAERWIKLMPHLNTRLLLVCSNYIEPEDHLYAPFDPAKEPLPSFSTSVRPKTIPPGPASSPFFPSPTQEQLSAYLDTQVEAFTALGKIAARYGVRIGYEALAWGTMVDNWEQVWNVVRRVGRDNVGVILDSFNFLANQYADPTVSPTFLRDAESCSQTSIPSRSTDPVPLPPRPHGLLTHLQPQNATHSALLQNLALLAQTVPAHKIFLYQVADAAPPSTPPATIEPGPHAPARMVWSRAARLFPCEDARGAWLPVTDVSLAVVEAGYPAAANYTCGDEDDAWWSVEVFNNSLMDARAECVREHGARGMAGLRTLWDRVCEGVDEANERSAASSASSEEEESCNSDDSVRGRSVRSDTDTSEEVPSLSAAVDECQPVGLAKLMDACIVG
ncbi:xylose isomerase-like protein [Mycena olivaceomarginata]|nr:xylose isomerase-like protein [Mycena olivaceomarginata]